MTGLEDRDAAAGAVAKAPRVTLDQIKTLIAGERYFLDDTLTICVLTLTNGYKVTGESAAADPANFNPELGRKIAKDKATAEIWPLAGFLLRDKLHRDEHPAAVRCKFQVWGHMPAVRQEVGPDGHWTDRHLADGATVQMGAVCADGFEEDGTPRCEENRIFGKWTPSGSISLHLRSAPAIAALAPGKTFYVDFIPAD